MFTYTFIFMFIPAWRGLASFLTHSILIGQAPAAVRPTSSAPDAAHREAAGEVHHGWRHFHPPAT